MTSHGDLKTMNGNAMRTPTSFPHMQEDSHQEDGHVSDLDQKRCGILLMLTDHNENGTESLNLMMIKFGESGLPVFRATSPLSRGTLKRGGGKLLLHFCADGRTIETVFCTIISVNQLSIYGSSLRCV